MVRLKANQKIIFNRECISFNSAMVRLKAVNFGQKFSR
jgi:hypothetical protein